MTKILKVALFASVLAFTITVNAGEAEDAIAAAKAAQKSAARVGGEWRDIRKLIRSAEKLLAQGKHEQAIKLAQKAEAHGRLGYIQATTQDYLQLMPK
ncbi:MAG: hypothetical protein QGM50_10415 [Anaerolineae bacterium]|nr:hypothetical protein [Anaerolineae bacterium]